MILLGSSCQRDYQWIMKKQHVKVAEIEMELDFFQKKIISFQKVDVY